jgi:hypothetical protein
MGFEVCEGKGKYPLEWVNDLYLTCLASVREIEGVSLEGKSELAVDRVQVMMMTAEPSSALTVMAGLRFHMTDGADVTIYTSPSYR